MNTTRSITDVDLYVAQRLKAARKEAGLAQERAAEHLGLTFQQVQKYEKGSNRISAGKLATLADLYGKPVAWFFPEAGKASATYDLPAELLSVRGGADMARHYIAIKDDVDRQVVANVAAALARNGASHG